MSRSAADRGCRTAAREDLVSRQGTTYLPSGRENPSLYVRRLVFTATPCINLCAANSDTAFAVAETKVHVRHVRCRILESGQGRIACAGLWAQK
jgi:hypothetical protein